MTDDAGAKSVPADPDARREPSPHQLRLFLMLAEELHFGRAAARLFMTQPALSQQIRALETRLGVPLVDRSSRAVVLTPAGLALLPEAQAIVDALARLRRRADGHAREIRGHLVIGFVGAESAMPHTHAVLTALYSRHPRITVEMRLLDLADHIEALLNGDVDAAFLRPPFPPGIQSLHLATEPRVACLPAGDPLATGAPITLAQLADHAVVGLPARTPRPWRDFWAVDPRPDGTPARFGPVATDVEALLHVVAGGLAMAFLPASARRLFPRPGVAYVDVSDVSPCTSALAWAPHRRSHPAVAALREAARVALRAAPGAPPAPRPVAL
ncbi:LysR family transcriptional regulator [Streptomyces sp. NBC_01803]|uniref:LysR family transcriptional regulator n=1 Tax=Streptomyces sp. NBC_01803 TaxID=2975946 RepID=UPI002DD9A6AB|nr:LysR substrate-binding domain-containing protein [Streptomyces sp. NBC_01803]WSA43143.1 LysR substrate-binding domain-containing protein [Streptomyces sp. NBC_01803]